MLIPSIPLHNNYSYLFTSLSLCSDLTLSVKQNNSSPNIQDIKLIRYLPCRIGIIPANQVSVIEEWIDGGAKFVLVSGSAENICALYYIRQRIIAVLTESNVFELKENELDQLKQSVAFISVQVSLDTAIGGIKALVSLAERLTMVVGKGHFSLQLPESLEATSSDERHALVGKLHHLNGGDYPIDIESSDVHLPSSETQTRDSFMINQIDASTTGFCICESLISCLRTDRHDNLYATVVCDELGIALGLVYSTAASLRASISSGRGVFWSRSRSELWRKGDTSGAFQELVSIKFDCDADAIRFQVRQMGNPPSFCHLGTRTCWGNDSGISYLYRKLQSRKIDAVEGSYTKRLFEDRQLLRNKLFEEVQEVIEAVDENDTVHVAEEVADLSYFLYAASVAGGISLEDINRVLDSRSLKIKRRPGNAKDHRIAAAEQIVSSME